MKVIQRYGCNFLTNQIIFMKRQFCISLLFVLGFLSMLKGQYNYDLYKFPETKVRGLNLNFNSFGNYSDFKLSPGLEARSLRYDIGADFFEFVNTSKKQKTDLVSFENDYHYSDFSFLPNFEKTKAFNMKVLKNQINRNYLNDTASFLGLKGKFFEVNHRLSLNFNDDLNLSNALAGANISLGLGFGRLEPVSEVFDAHFLMNDLLEAGVIGAKFSEEELYELAALMASVKNRRVFDFRRANIYQLSELSKWLTSKGIDQNIKTFTILNDNWTGNFTAQRVNGKRLTVHISPWAQQNWYKYDNSNNRQNEFSGGAVASISYVNAKNKNLFFGTETSLRLSHGLHNSVRQANNVTTMTGSYGVILNPNSRTTFSVAPTISLATQKFNEYAARLSLPIQANYFINNRSRISGFLNLDWINNENVIFERPSEVSEFNPNFRSDVYTPNSSIISFEGSRFNISGGLNFTYTLF